MPITKGRKMKKKLGTRLLLLAPIFYFFPDFTIIDILPDVIGYILAVSGLSMLADISEDMADVKRRFSHMIILGFAKIIAFVMTFAMTSDNERPTIMLTITFIAAVAEFVVLIPAYAKLFDSLVYLGTREDGQSVFLKNGESRKKRSYTDRIKRLTIAFIIVKNITLVLPEFMSLSVDAAIQSYTYSMADNLNYFRILGMLVSLVFGIVWLCRIEGYFGAVRRDTSFIERLEAKYRTEVLSNDALFARKRLHFAFLMLGLAAIFAIDFYIGGEDGYNIIPDFISAALFIVGILALPNTIDALKKRIAVIISSIYCPVSAASWVLNILYFNRFASGHVLRNPVANQWWQYMLAASALESLLFAATVLSVCFLLFDVINNHTGFIIPHASIDSTAKATELHRALRKQLIIAMVFSVITAIFGFLRVVMFSKSTVSFAVFWLFETLLSTIFNATWIIELIFAALFAVLFCRALLRINEEIEEKYQLS